MNLGWFILVTKLQILLSSYTCLLLILSLVPLDSRLLKKSYTPIVPALERWRQKSKVIFNDILSLRPGCLCFLIFYSLTLQLGFHPQHHIYPTLNKIISELSLLRFMVKSVLTSLGIFTTLATCGHPFLKTFFQTWEVLFSHDVLIHSLSLSPFPFLTLPLIQDLQITQCRGWIHECLFHLHPPRWLHPVPLGHMLSPIWLSTCISLGQSESGIVYKNYPFDDSI